MLILSSIVNASGVLYAVNRTGDRNNVNLPSTLYSIDKVTGKFTTIGSVGFSVTDLAWDQTRGILYGASSFRDSNYSGLIQINTKTGSGIAIGTNNWGIGNPEMNMSHIAVDSAGNLYGAPSKITEYNLVGINVNTGVATGVGAKIVDIPAGILGSASFHGGKSTLFFDASDTLWIKSFNDDLYTVDVTTGISSAGINESTFEFTGGIGAVVPGKHGVYDTDTNSYWTALGGTYINKYNMGTGISDTLTLTNPPPVGARGFSLAIAPVPVPASVWLFLSGFIGLFSIGNRKLRA